MKKLRVYQLAIKYWLQGDSWQEALRCARIIALGFKENEE